MKKIFGLLLLVGAFTQVANAQITPQKNKKAETATIAKEEVKTIDSAVEAKKNVVLLATVVTLTPQDEENFFRLFEHKFRILNENISTERKDELARIIEAKIAATLNSDQMTKLYAKPEVLRTLKN